MNERRITVPDEVDLDSAPGLRDDLSKAIVVDDAHLLVDCTHLRFVDSTGVAVLLEANAKLMNQGRHMRIVNVHGAPRKVFEALGLADLLDHEHDSEAALPSHSPGRASTSPDEFQASTG
jgi:anti-anti-sigma factor